MAQATKLFDLSAHVAGKEAKAAPELVQPEAPRKLVRPRLPEHMQELAMAPRRLRGAAPYAQHVGHTATTRMPQQTTASHAEALFFQKQMQSQTPLIFVLEDGERVQGVIEWYDRNSIKVRNTRRVLIFKSSIKYLYKAAEAEG